MITSPTGASEIMEAGGFKFPKDSDEFGAGINLSRQTSTQSDHSRQPSSISRIFL